MNPASPTCRLSGAVASSCQDSVATAGIAATDCHSRVHGSADVCACLLVPSPSGPAHTMIICLSGCLGGEAAQDEVGQRAAFAFPQPKGVHARPPALPDTH